MNWIRFSSRAAAERYAARELASWRAVEVCQLEEGSWVLVGTPHPDLYPQVVVSFGLLDMREDA